VKLLNKDHIVVDRRQSLKAIKSKKIDQVEKIGAARPGLKDTIFVVTERLPLKVMRVPGREGGGKGSLAFEWLSFASDDVEGPEVVKVARSASRHAGYVVENLRQLRAQCRVIFIGGLGVDVLHEDQEAVAEELWSTMQCVPVFLEPEVRAEYEDFCHSVLKPVFHFVHPTNCDMQKAFSSEDRWHQYVSVNREYIKPVLQHFNDGDLLMVFDYGLMMCPSLVGARARTANIGFFFNTPFPSSEIFRAIPKRKEALRSLLNADMISFHCYTYARHFLSCCSGLLGLENRPAKCGMISLNFNGHHVGVRACHVGIDAETFARCLQENNLLQQKAVWAAKLRELDKHVVLVGYDDMEPLSGITLKLRAFRAMLRLFPEYRESAVLIQVAIPLHDARGMLAYPEYIDQVQDLVDDINLKFPGAVVMMKKKMSFSERVALFRYARVVGLLGLFLAPS
jgi:trehalose-6-phosphate synthase